MKRIILYFLCLATLTSEAQWRPLIGSYKFNALKVGGSTSTDTTTYKPVVMGSDSVVKRLTFWPVGSITECTISSLSGLASGSGVFGVSTSFDALNLEPVSKVQQAGTVIKAKFNLVSAPSQLTNFYITVWRKNGSNTYDLISRQDVKTQLVAGDNTVTLSSITVQAGDCVGWGYVASSNPGTFITATSASTSMRYYGPIQGSTGINFEGTGTASAWYVPIQLISNSSCSPSVVNSGSANRLAYYAATGTTVSNLSAITANRALISDANGLPTHATTTATELGYLSGVTSAIQTQLSGKQATLVSGTNIKTVNGNSLLGSGDVTVSGSVADGDKGDITVSGSGATWTIDALAVTNAKINDVAIGKVTGRTTFTSGRILIGDGSADATTSANLTYTSGQLKNTGSTFFNGAVYNNVVTLTGGVNTTLDDTYHYVNVDASASSGQANIYLPSVSSKSGLRYVIKKVDNSGIPVVITPNGAQTIEGASSKTLATQYKTITIYTEGSNWFIEYQN